MLSIELRAVLPLAEAQLETAWQTYVASTASPDDSGFLDFLVATAQLGAEVRHALQPQVQLATEALLDHTLNDADAGLILMPANLTQPADLTLLDEDQTISVAESFTAETELPELPPRYELLATVGHGAMGEVLLARDQFLQRKVAYKQLPATSEADRNAARRFVKEAQITSQLTHPNIVPIYHLERQTDGRIAYSMKLIRGHDLKQMLAEARSQYQAGGQPDAGHRLDTLLEHFLKVCEAVHYAHRKGVIHRDLKPANIMVGPYGEVYVMDWGIARLIGAPMLDEAQQLEADDMAAALGQMDLDQTRTGQILGTPRYMSPQQAAGHNDRLDGRSDLFALGLILFEIATLKPAFTAREPVALLKQVLKADKQPCRHAFPQVRIDDELRAIIDKATARKPEDRYADVAAFAEDLRRYRRGEAVLARPDNTWQRLSRWTSQHQRLTLLLVLALFLFCAAGIGLSLWRERQLLTASRRHEQRLQHLTGRLAEVGEQLDSRLTRIEGLLDALADVSLTALSGTQRGDTRYFLHSAFAPPDLAYSLHYRKPISVDWPVFKLAPGVSETAVKSRLEQLAPLRRTFRRLFLQSAVGGQLPTDSREQHRLIGEIGVPLVWGYIGLEPGIMFAYPGKASYAADYDPRQRPWYREAAGRYGTHWGQPYMDIQGQGTLLPVTRALYGPTGRLLGVAGLEIPLTALGGELQLTNQPGLRGLYLIDPHGTVLAQSALSRRPQAKLLQQAAELGDGYLETDDDLYVFSRLQSLPARVVLRVDAHQANGDSP